MTVLVKLERHEAAKTDAFTRWLIKLPSGEKISFKDAFSKGIAKLYATTLMPDKTHWVEYWEVSEDVELVRVRKTNRGNIVVTYYKPKELEVPKYEELKAVGGC